MSDPSITEQILSTIAAKFTAQVPTAITFRSRKAALALAEGIAIIVEPEEEPVTYIANVAAKRDFMAKITILGRGDVPDSTIDPTRVVMHSVLMADPSVGGIVQRIVEEGAKWTLEEADNTAISLETRYKFIYLAKTNSLTTAP